MTVLIAAIIIVAIIHVVLVLEDHRAEELRWQREQGLAAKPVDSKEQRE